ncbi:ISAs1 family transposase [Escherichia coli]|nr:ISAs1 family transposase [Escherichia coli]EFL6887440.1 ISAs1 family transposase [Escherichia coli]
MSTGLRFTLEVDGLPPDAFAVVSFHLNQSLSSLFSLDLSLVSQQFLSLEFAQVLDKMAYLTIWQGDEVQRRVKGVVTWFELGENDKNQMLYSMKVHPPLWRAGLRQNFRIFQNEDIKSILGTMLQENGVTEWSPLFSEPHPSREFCVQYGETDYDFLCRMAAEEGIFFYEEHAYKSTDQSLVLCDTVRHLPESFEIPWNPNTRTEVSTLCISQFRYSAQIRPSSVVTKDYTFKRPGWAGRFEQEGQHQDYQRTQYEVYDYPGRFKGAHGQNFARWQMDGWRNNAETARGMSRSPEIWPGRRIVLTGHPQANLNREWQVVASELHGEQPQAVPGRQGAGTALENHFAVIPADRTWRPQPLLKPLVDGPQSAVVTGPAGEEIFCDEHGRVRVKFNWDRYNPSNQDSSCWIRVAQAWAGTGFGNLAIPRVGQEVIVDFLNGDPDQPIIMGRTYHHENRTPGSLPGTKTQMTIRSKTYKGSGFNELKFDDATGKEQVYIHAQKNMNTEVLNNRTTDVINNHAETIGNNQMIAVISPAKIHECFINWMRDCHSSDDKDVIAIDGKTLRHSYDKSRRRGAIHVISAFSTMHSLVIGQIRTDEKSNEITAIPELLNMLDIKGKIITTDAMGCQKDIAEKIQKQGGDYLFAVKGNQGRLNKAFEEKFPLKELNNPAHDSYAMSEKSHGREEIRLHIVCDVPDELIDFTFEWKGLKKLCVAVSFRSIIAEQKKELEMTVRYYISSADLTAEKFATAIRNHWHVENKLHWRLDVVMNEDDCKIRRGNAAELFSGIRHIAINILTNDKVFKAGLRRKMRKAAMDRNYLASVLTGSGLS